MDPLANLIAAAGRWHATYRLRDPENLISGDSESIAVVTPVLGGRFVRIDYTWADKGHPQAGSLLVGCETPASAITVVWIDTWHNSDRMMICQGRFGDADLIEVRGTYEVPPGPHWGWRTQITAKGDTLSIVMFNVSPSGHEALAVDAQYRRA